MSCSGSSSFSSFKFKIRYFIMNELSRSMVVDSSSFTVKASTFIIAIAKLNTFDTKVDTFIINLYSLILQAILVP